MIQAHSTWCTAFLLLLLGELYSYAQKKLIEKIGWEGNSWQTYSNIGTADVYYIIYRVIRIVNRGTYRWHLEHGQTIWKEHKLFVSKFSRKSDTKKSKVFFWIVPRDESRFIKFDGNLFHTFAILMEVSGIVISSKFSLKGMALAACPGFGLSERY